MSASCNESRHLKIWRNSTRSALTPALRPDHGGCRPKGTRAVLARMEPHIVRLKEKKAREQVPRNPRLDPPRSLFFPASVECVATAVHERDLDAAALAHFGMRRAKFSVAAVRGTMANCLRPVLTQASIQLISKP